MTETDVTSALIYYARIGASLFPIPAGQKSPIGIVESFAKDCSTNPEQWNSWYNQHHCNFGIVAGPSRLVIVDIDCKEGREAAWHLWIDLCTTWGFAAPFMPQVQSARGGWHVYFQVPDDVDATKLRQPDAIKKLINIRAGNGFTVAASSHFESLPYVLLNDVAPYPAPSALIEHCTRKAPIVSNVASHVGSRDAGDVAALIKWLAERNAFDSYEDWCSAGMALKLEFGDDGLALWQLTHNDTVTADVELTKWNSFSTEPTPGCVTLQSLLANAHKLGWRGSVRRSTASLFGDVAAIAAAAGAQLSSGGPVPGPANGAIPMMAGQEALTDLGRPILQEFLKATTDAPLRPISDDFPTLPESMAGHGLYGILCDAIARTLAMAEPPSKFKAARVVGAMAVLSVTNLDVYEAVARRCDALGWPLNRSKIKLAAAALADKVERVFVKQDDWIYDPRSGEPQADNSDNVAVFMGVLGVQIRWNAWTERMEIQGGTDDLRWDKWTYIDDSIVAKLRTRGNRTKTRFRPGKDFFWESLISLAHANTVDPACDMLVEMQTAWDGQPRLSIWLSAACGIDCDPYHQAVGRNVIGGMVRRIRQPGCKHDYMPVFYGPQGTGKSTMAAIIADMGQSTIAQLAAGHGAPWFSDEVKLGDESKELVLSLAGKCMVEIGEMGMRAGANANHIKAMLSRQVDRGRTAYARTVTDRPRRNVFFGTVNDDEPLVDPTGNRRFLPVCIEKEINLDWLRDNIAQLIGEAATLESQGADFAIPRAVWGDAAERQESARSASDMEIMLADWFTETPFTGPVNYITASDLVHLSNVCGWRNGGATAARGAVMKRLGFRSEKPLINGKRTVVWVRAPADTRPADIARLGVRYLVTIDNNGRAGVQIRREIVVSA